MRVATSSSPSQQAPEATTTSPSKGKTSIVEAVQQFSNIDVSEWSKEQVCLWLRSIFPSSTPAAVIDKCEQAFAENEIIGSALLLLTSADLKEMGITALGPRKVIEAAIKEFTKKRPRDDSNSQNEVKSSTTAQDQEQPYKRQKTQHTPAASSSLPNAPSSASAPSSSPTPTLVDDSVVPAAADLSTADIKQIEALLEFDEKLVEQLKPRKCAICLEDVDVDFIQPLQRCSHEFCRDCLRNYFISKIESRSIPFTCPLPSCKAEVVLEDLELLLEKKFVDLFEEVSLGAFVEKNPNFKNCPTPNCDYVFFQENPKEVDFQCPVCKKRYCLACKVPYHTGSTCEAYQQWAIENGMSDEYTQDWLAKKQGKNVQRCPRCQNWVQKSSGCDHMTCRCGEHFCYRCGEGYQNHQHTCKAPMPNGRDEDEEDMEGDEEEEEDE